MIYYQFADGYVVHEWMYLWQVGTTLLSDKKPNLVVQHGPPVAKFKVKMKRIKINIAPISELMKNCNYYIQID